MHMVAEEGMQQLSNNLLLKYLIKTALGEETNTLIQSWENLYTYIIHVYIYYTCIHILYMYIMHEQSCA